MKNTLSAYLEDCVGFPALHLFKTGTFPLKKMRTAGLLFKTKLFSPLPPSDAIRKQKKTILGDLFSSVLL